MNLTDSSPLPDLPQEQAVYVRYTNWRGETAVRHILPLRLHFGSTPWHPTPQWLLEAQDLEKGVERGFALSGIEAWSAEPLADAQEPQQVSLEQAERIREVVERVAREVFQERYRGMESSLESDMDFGGENLVVEVRASLPRAEFLPKRRRFLDEVAAALGDELAQRSILLLCRGP